MKNPVYDAIFVETSSVGEDIRNDGEDYYQGGMFGLRVTNSVPDDGLPEAWILGPSVVEGSVINSGTIPLAMEIQKSLCCWMI